MQGSKRRVSCPETFRKHRALCNQSPADRNEKHATAGMLVAGKVIHTVSALYVMQGRVRVRNLNEVSKDHQTRACQGFLKRRLSRPVVWGVLVLQCSAHQLGVNLHGMCAQGTDLRYRPGSRP